MAMWSYTITEILMGVPIAYKVVPMGGDNVAYGGWSSDDGGWYWYSVGL
jgi:hypothetical protein